MIQNQPPAAPPPKKAPRTRATARVVGHTCVVVGKRVQRMFTTRGTGYRRLAESHAAAVAGDTMIAVALAGTLFFSVPSTEARANVAQYLLLTLAPFAIIGPFLAAFFERFPTAYRGGLIASAGLRAVVAIGMLMALDSVWLFPLAFALLVLSRFHGISRSSLLPQVVGNRSELIAANAQLARVGIIGSLAAVVVAGGVALTGPGFALFFAAVAFVISAVAAAGLPTLSRLPRSAVQGGHPRAKRALPQPVRLARFATASVRFLNGFILLLVAFAFRSIDAGALDFAALLAAGGLGYFISAFVTPVLDRVISEEPMVVAGLAVEAAAAFIAAQYFGLPAAMALAAAAGFAWGTAKFGFDGLLQSTVPADMRGRAFTSSETFFQIAWVLGALLPVLPGFPVELGLATAGILALVVQVVYVSFALVPVVAQRRSNGPPDRDDGSPGNNVLDVL
ncbi:hypothetical protein BMS3Bbin02_01836 [bacterium BMS3Bbin02]|nr:hypothetical protein BMS3Bbin02_01836 [bacterium BMS3Bbin02]